MLSKRMAVLTCVMALAGCTQTNWQKAGITDPAETQRQLKIDNGRCTAEAYRAVPQTSSTRVVVNTAPEPAPGGYITRLPESYDRMNETIIGQPGDDARETIIDGCMARLGWSPKA